MKKLLRSILIVSVLSVCLVSLVAYQGSCQDLPKIEVLFSPEQGQEILQRLKDAIQNAKGRVYILIYSFTLDELAQTIIEKHREGLDIKVIMDKGQAGSKVTENLRQAGIPLAVKAGSKGGYMHMKALITDDIVLTGSYNYSKNATSRSDENFLIIRDKDIVEAHLAKFNQLWPEELPVVSPEIKKEQERAPPCEVTVYITRTGRKYHRLECGYLRESCIPISLIGAIQQGYTPCKVCRPPSSDAYRTHGRFFYHQGQFDAAVKCYDQAIKLNPNSAYLYNDRGMSYKELGKLDRAIGDFSQAIEVWLGFADAYYNRGIAYFEQEKYDQALKDFQTARYLFPDEQDKLKCEEFIEKIDKIKAKSQSNVNGMFSIWYQD